MHGGLTRVLLIAERSERRVVPVPRAQLGVDLVDGDGRAYRGRRRTVVRFALDWRRENGLESGSAPSRHSKPPASVLFENSPLVNASLFPLPLFSAKASLLTFFSFLTSLSLRSAVGAMTSSVSRSAMSTISTPPSWSEYSSSSPTRGLRSSGSLYEGADVDDGASNCEGPVRTVRARPAEARQQSKKERKVSSGSSYEQACDGFGRTILAGAHREDTTRRHTGVRVLVSRSPAGSSPTSTSSTSTSISTTTPTTIRASERVAWWGDNGRYSARGRAKQGDKARRRSASALGS